jgi:hypothetical protein
MKYLLVEASNQPDDIPLKSYHQLDSSDSETRKIEIFKDGSVGWADGDTEVQSTRLARELFPTIEEIAEDADFSPKEITSEEFENAWIKYVSL